MLASQDPDSIHSERPLFLQLPPVDLVHLPSLEQFTRFVVTWIQIASPIDLDARLDLQALQARNPTGLTTLSSATKLTANPLSPDLLPAYQTPSGPTPAIHHPEQLKIVHDLAILCRMSRPDLAKVLRRLFPDANVTRTHTLPQSGSWWLG